MAELNNESVSDPGSARAPDTGTIPERLLSTEELAEYLGWHPGSVRRSAADGDLPHYKIGKYLKFSLSEILSASRRGGAE